MSISTIIALMAIGVQADLIYVPVPATREYVDGAIAQSTKGLDYLVRTSLEKDLDALNYLVTCMRQPQHTGALRRIEDEYEELLGERYQHKTCAQLEQQMVAR